MPDAIRIEVERCIRLWGCGGRAAEVLQQSRVWTPGAAGAAEAVASMPDLGATGVSFVFAKGRG